MAGQLATAACRHEGGPARVGVLVLSQFLEDRYALDLVADGAQGIGYLLKEKVGHLRMFTGAVHRIAAGGSRSPPAW